MSKLYSFIAATFLTLGFVAGASAAEPLLVDVRLLEQAAMDEAAATGLNWKVGDKADYSVKAGFINGSNKTFVREETADGLWQEQNLDLGFAGKQKVEVLFNKADGQVKKILVNGEEQELPTADDVEVIEMKEANVTVPAGTFDAIYVKVKTKSDGKEQEAWLNPQAIPMSGLLKSVASTPIGKMNVELTSYSRAQ